MQQVLLTSFHIFLYRSDIIDQPLPLITILINVKTPLLPTLLLLVAWRYFSFFEFFSEAGFDVVLLGEAVAVVF